MIIGVLDNRFRRGLVRELEDEDIDPDEKGHEGDSCEDEEEVWGRVGCEEGTGEGAKDAEGGVRDDASGDVRFREQPTKIGEGGN